MRAPTPADRFSNAKTLLDYGFSKYEYFETSKAGSIVQNVNVGKGIEKNVNLQFESTTGSIQKKGSSSNITTTIEINKNIQAPIEKGATLGTAKFYLNEKEIGSTNLVAEKAIKKMNFINMFEFISGTWGRLLR